MLNKKGDLTIRYVILFALALIVLVVVTLIFYGGAADFASKIKETLAGIWSAKPDNFITNP
ncbi:MAG: hypothetical protein KKA79_09915 [Nanoarchaeota archaeon]|nr:hypothetical protein [Nanoarchaeota archaeon]MCG2718638.1 hypothetical protein [Nanoarchaeota archaeon]